jgi:V/A-type H+-transporting ATPase subunit E
MVDNVDKITSKILEDAERKSEDIIEQAGSEAREKLDASKRKGEATKNRLVDEAEKAAEQTKKKITAESKIKARTILLESKEKLIQEAFAKAREELESLPNQKSYPDKLEKLAVDTCIQLGGGELELVVRKMDEKIVNAALNKIEKEVKAVTGEVAKISISTADIGPGVIIQRADGKVGIDSTFQTRLELLRPGLRLKVAEALFS